MTGAPPAERYAQPEGRFTVRRAQAARDFISLLTPKAPRARTAAAPAKVSIFFIKTRSSMSVSTGHPVCLQYRGALFP